MKAIVYDRHGPADVLHLGEVPEPTVGPDDVLVAIRATSVNPVDCKIRQGYQRAINPQRFPAVPGMDLSGEVLEVGANVVRFEPGDAVWASPHHRRCGTFAERIAVRADELAPKPPSLSHEEAASLPLVALTAWNCLVDAAKLKSGDHLFVQAGAGGVGSAAIQIGKAIGATVTTTCSPANAQFVTSLGADRVIDYRSERWQDSVRDVDVFLACLGPQETLDAIAVLSPGGCVTSINSGMVPAVSAHGPWLGLLPMVARMLRCSLTARLQGRRVHHVVRKASGLDLAALGSLVDQGTLRPVVAQVLPLENAADAHRLSEGGHVRGKVVVAIPE